MMIAWYVDPGLNTLIRQWRAWHPGAIVGTIGDRAHQEEDSEHNPEDDGSVDAGDFMKGNGVTDADLEELAAVLAHNRDKRVFYIIWHDRIFTNMDGRAAWAWYDFDGDYHDHVHVSVNDKYEGDASPWNLGEEHDMPLTTDLIPVSDDSNEALFGGKLPKGTLRPAATFLQLAGIHSARAAASSAKAVTELQTMNGLLTEIRDLLKTPKK